VIGLVLAAGVGRRLAPLTDDLPKTLLPVRGNTSVLELTLSNFVEAGIRDVAVVTGFASHRLVALVPQLEEAHGVQIELIHNDRALDWNNAYSLWCARALFSNGVLLCNGDTVHPAVVEHQMLSERGPAIVLGIDRHKALGEEEMKIRLDAAGKLSTISKAVDPATADGEYIGITVIEPAAAEPLAAALETTWRRDPQLYYEDGYQELVERGMPPGLRFLAPMEWVEIDDHADLARAQAVACRY
jgi:choline kinase